MLVKTQARIKTLPCAYEPNILHGISFQGWCFPCHNEASGDLTSLTPHLQTLTKFLSQPAPKPFQNSQPELTCPKSGLKVNARLFNFPIRSFVTSYFYIFSLISHKISSLALHGGADNHFTYVRDTWNAKTVNEIETIEICCFLPKISPFKCRIADTVPFTRKRKQETFID